LSKVLGRKTRVPRPCLLRAFTLALRISLLVSICLPLPVLVSLCVPGLAQADTPVSLSLSGWGWCVAYRDIANVTMNLTGTMIPRASASDIADLCLTGNLQFNLSDSTDNYALELRGTKVRSLFFLRQASGGRNRWSPSLREPGSIAITTWRARVDWQYRRLIMWRNPTSSC